MADALWSADLIEARTGNVVKGSDVLGGKIAGVVMAPFWLPLPLRQMLASFSDQFDQLRDEKKPVEFIYIPLDRLEEHIARLKSAGQSDIIDERPDGECFEDLRKQLPEGWFALPLEDAETKHRVAAAVMSGPIFGMAFVGDGGEVITRDGMQVLGRWGAEAFPFTTARIEELQKERDARALSQTLRSLLVTKDRDYVVTNDGTKVDVDALEGKTVGLYFSAGWCGPCHRFTPVLSEFYRQLKDKNEDFEVVFVSADKNEASFEEYFNKMPWLAIPFVDVKSRNFLEKYFDLGGIPTLVILDKTGKTLNTEAVELVFEHGVDVFPFTPERMAELKAAEEAKRAAQTLESLLVTDSRSYVTSHGSKKVEVSELKGKTVGLYFSAHWCPPCRNFTPKLADVYRKLKEKNADFEVVFVSSDRDETAFQAYYDTMPWLALPFSDRHTKSTLSSYFKVGGIPSLIVIGPDGKTVSDDGVDMVAKFGMRAFPFTAEHVENLDEKLSIEAAEKLPKEIMHPGHPEHPLVLLSDAYNNGAYGCDVCDGEGTGWVYHCGTCSFDVHPHCAAEATASEAPHAKEGWVCEGGVCKKA